MRIKLNLFFILFLFSSYFAGWLQQSLLLFASVLLHEAGHVLAARRLGIKVYEVELLPYGGVARMEELSKLGGRAEALVSAAGPAISLLLALLCKSFSGYSDIFATAFRYNLIIAVFNLIPVLPLDGGKIARNFAVFFMGYRQATNILSSAGKLAALVIFGINLYRFASGYKSAALIITAVFIYLGTVREEKNSSFFYLFKGNSAKEQATAEGRIRKRFIKVSADTPLKYAVNRFSPATLCCFEVLDGEGEISRVLEEEEIMEGLLKYGYDGKIGQIINNFAKSV
ncbi:MAG: M50 family metallopeptidase [Pseudomonadota bacterium]